MPILTKIEPKDLRGLTSYGMVLVANNNERVALLFPDTKVTPGGTIK